MTDLKTTALKILSSKKFFIGILALIIVQSGWYAFSFKTSQFDEVFHFDFIKMYSEQTTPFISSQELKWDRLGETTRYPSYLYHYTMSVPLRIVKTITPNEVHQVISLRLISVAFFVIGVILYRKLLRKIGASDAVANAILLFTALIPNFAILAGTINYDNLIFMLSGIVLLAAVELITKKKVNFISLGVIVSVSLLATLIKFTFLAFFIPILIYCGFVLYKEHGSDVLKKLRISFAETRAVAKVLVCLLLLASTLLVFERHGYNLIKYREPKPVCQSILSEKRCSVNFVANRNIELLKNKPQGFKPAPPTWYSGIWVESMTSTSLKIAQSKPAPLLMGLLFIFGVPISIALILVYLRDITKREVDKLLLGSAVFYTIVVMAYNYLLYVKYAQPIAMNGRYLLPVLPIFLFYVYRSTSLLIRNSKNIALVLLMLALVSMTQGGGIAMHLIHTGSGAYWGNSFIVDSNTAAKAVLNKLILERSVFSK